MSLIGQLFLLIATSPLLYEWDVFWPLSKIFSKHNRYEDVKSSRLINPIKTGLISFIPTKCFLCSRHIFLIYSFQGIYFNFMMRSHVNEMSTKTRKIKRISTAGSEWLPEQRAKCKRGSGCSIAYACRASPDLNFVLGESNKRSHYKQKQDLSVPIQILDVEEIQIGKTIASVLWELL